MKRVTFKIAKALKDAGYPQDSTSTLDGYDILGEPTTTYSSAKKCEYISPTYIEVWLWLWQEKQFSINVEHFDYVGWRTNILSDKWYETQEEAIEKAIEYLVENDLLI